MKARIWTDKQGIRQLEDEIVSILGENSHIFKLKGEMNKELKRNKDKVVKILEEIEFKKLGEVRHEVRKR